MKKAVVIFISICLLLLTLAGCQQNSSTSNESTILGKVTAVNGNTITLALGNQSGPSNQGNPPTGSTSNSAGNDQGSSNGTPPAMPSGNPNSAGTPPSGNTNTQSGNNAPSTTPSGNQNSSAPQGTLPSAPSGNQSGNAPQGTPPSGIMNSFTATGEEKAITITANTTIQIGKMDSTSSGSVSDITVGSILSVKLSGSTVTQITIQSDGNGSMNSSSSGNSAQ